MRWPEALTLTRAIWNMLPRKYKYNHQFRQFEDYFNNFDCSTEGFEGIRAEDILPLLVRQFNFEIFFGHGNLIDPFIDRNFGPNFDPSDPKDTAFIDYIHQLNQQLISDGILKPTSMTAVMVNEPVSTTKVFQHWDPAFCIRDPKAAAPAYDLDKLIAPIPLQPAPADSPLAANHVMPYPIGQKISFTTGSANTPYQGSKYLTYGWGYPETDFTWSNCEDAGLLFPLTQRPRRNAWLHLEFIPYQSKRYPHTNMEIFVNGQRIDTLQYDNDTQAGVCRVRINIPEEVLRTKDNIEVSFFFPNRRLPQFEAGDDLRSLGIALISASISDT